MTRVLALDLSLTATGIATIGGDQVRAATIDPGKARGHHRLRYILNDIAVRLADFWPDLVAIEELELPRVRSTSVIPLAELHGIVKFWLHPRVPVVLINPTLMKLYATGRGSAGKEQVVLQVERRFGALVQVADNNQADALVMAAMAADHYGSPLAAMPAVNRAALGKVAWPTLPTRPGHPTTPGAGADLETARLREPTAQHAIPTPAVGDTP